MLEIGEKGGRDKKLVQGDEGRIEGINQKEIAINIHFEIAKERSIVKGLDVDFPQN